MKAKTDPRIEKAKETKERRRTKTIRVFDFKLQRLKKSKLEKLKRVFLEAKWFYNWMIANIGNGSLKDSSFEKATVVEIKVKDTFEERELTYLSSQMKQSIKEKIKENLKGLAIQKKRGRKVGKLKFKSRYSCIPLKQFGNTFKFVNEQKTKVYIQGLGKFRVLGRNGLRRKKRDGREEVIDLWPKVEVGRSYLVQRSDGFHLLLVCFIDQKDEEKFCDRKKFDTKAIAFDLGIETQLTFSNGLKVSWEVGESERLKRLQQEFNWIRDGVKKTKRPRRKLKELKEKIRKEYLHLYYRRKEIENKIFAYLKNFDLVCFQDDSIKSWHEGWFGRKIQHTALGGITARLKKLKKRQEKGSLATPRVVMLERFIPTTKTCHGCNAVVEVKLSERIFRCPRCGLEMDRDHNSTLVMLKATVGLDRPEGEEPMPEEGRTLAELLRGNPHVRVAQVLPLGIPHPSG